jgi:glycosyltransferase involved in cell wall biosynthesis
MLYTVIIPVFNVTEYLDDALKSLSEQTEKDFEVIIIDDGSKDPPIELVKRWQNLLRIKLILLEYNSGVSHARNIGISHVCSEFIAFMDADDAWFPQKMKQQLLYLEENTDKDGIYSNALIIDHRGKSTGKTRITPNNNICNLHGEVTIEWVDKIVLSSLVLRLDFFKQYGNFDENLKIAEDWDLFLRKPLNLAFIPEPLIKYRRHVLSVGKISSHNKSNNPLAVINRYSHRYPKKITHEVRTRVYCNEFGNSLRAKRILLASIFLAKSLATSPTSTFKLLTKTILDKLKYHPLLH